MEKAFDRVSYDFLLKREGLAMGAYRTCFTGA